MHWRYQNFVLNAAEFTTRSWQCTLWRLLVILTDFPHDWLGRVIQPRLQILCRRKSNLRSPVCKTRALTTASWELVFYFTNTCKDKLHKSLHGISFTGSTYKNCKTTYRNKVLVRCLTEWGQSRFSYDMKLKFPFQKEDQMITIKSRKHFITLPQISRHLIRKECPWVEMFQEIRGVPT